MPGAAILSVLLATALQATPDAGPRVLSVEFRGVRSLDDQLLQSIIDTQPSRCRSIILFAPCWIGTYSWAEVFDRLEQGSLARDSARIDSLYNSFGFPSARVAPLARRVADGVHVIFEIDEGRPTVVASLTVEGEESFDPPLDIPQRLPLVVGRPYALRLLDATVYRLRSVVAERGYPWVDVEVSGDVDAGTGRANVILRIQPGPRARFGRVQALVEPPLRVSTVQPFFAHHEGERFQPSRIEETLRRIRALPVVSDAGVQLRAIPRDTVVPTVVGVRPARVHGFGVEGTVASVTCLTLHGRWQHRHMLGAPRVFTLSAGASNLLAEETGGFPCSGTGEGEFRGRDWLLDADLWQPALFGDGRTALRLGIFTERWSLANAFIREGAGARIGLTHELTKRMALRLEWKPERSRRDAADLYFCGNYALCTGTQLDSATGLHWFAPAGLTLLLTSESPPAVLQRVPPWWAAGAPLDFVTPWRYGVRADLTGAASASGSDYTFSRVSLEGSVTRVLGRTAEIASRIRLGMVTGDEVLPPDARLFSGGLGSVRGAGQSLLGPAVLLADSAAAAACVPVGCSLTNVDPDHLQLRPLGGDRLIEASLEARLWLSDQVQLAAFADLGLLERRDVERLPTGAVLGTQRETLLSPGLGIRARSPLGPLRLDIAFDPRATRSVPLFTRTADGIAFLGQARYDPFSWDRPGAWREFRRRLRLWVGVGQPF